MTPHTVPKGWVRGQAIQTLDRRRIHPSQRFANEFRQKVAIVQWWDRWPPYLDQEVAENTVFAIEFSTKEDANQWLDWWFDTSAPDGATGCSGTGTCTTGSRSASDPT